MTSSARTPLLVALAIALAATAWLAMRPAGRLAVPASPHDASEAPPAIVAPSGSAPVDPGVVKHLADPIAVPADAIATAASTGVASLSAEQRAAYDRYAAQVEDAIRSDAAAITTLLAEYGDALANRDVDTLATHWATDEGADPRAAAAARIDSLPQILEVEPQQTVTAFAVGSTTVYIGFVVAVWRDAGIDSEHTITVPMRRTASGWRLSGIDPTHTPNTVVVTTVTSL